MALSNAELSHLTNVGKGVNALFFSKFIGGIFLKSFRSMKRSEWYGKQSFVYERAISII